MIPCNRLFITSCAALSSPSSIEVALPDGLNAEHRVKVTPTQYYPDVSPLRIMVSGGLVADTIFAVTLTEVSCLPGEAPDSTGALVRIRILPGRLWVNPVASYHRAFLTVSGAVCEVHTWHVLDRRTRLLHVPCWYDESGLRLIFLALS